MSNNRIIGNFIPNTYEPTAEVPSLGTIVIESITGPGVVHHSLSETDVSRAKVQINQAITVTATVPHPDASPPEQTWTTPMRGPQGEGHIMYATTHRPAGSQTVAITFTPTQSGKYVLTESEINSDLDGYRFSFAGMEIIVLMETT